MDNPQGAPELPEGLQIFPVNPDGRCLWHSLAVGLEYQDPMSPFSALSVAGRTADWIISNQHRIDLHYLGGRPFGLFHVETLNSVGGIKVQHQAGIGAATEGIKLRDASQLAELIRGIPHPDNYSVDYYPEGLADGSIQACAEAHGRNIAICDGNGRVVDHYAASSATQFDFVFIKFTRGRVDDDYRGGHYDAYVQPYRTHALLHRLRGLQTLVAATLTTEEAQALTQAGYTPPPADDRITATLAETVHFTAQHLVRRNASHASPPHAFHLGDTVYDRRRTFAPIELVELTVTSIRLGMGGTWFYQLNGAAREVSEQFLTGTRPTPPLDGAAAAAAAAEVFLLAPNGPAGSSEAFQALMTMDYGNIGDEELAACGLSFTDFKEIQHTRALYEHAKGMHDLDPEVRQCQDATEARRRRITTLAQSAAGILHELTDADGAAIYTIESEEAFRRFITMPSFYSLHQMELRAALGGIAAEDVNAPIDPPDRKSVV
jgi:hypothetical protein